MRAREEIFEEFPVVTATPALDAVRLLAEHR